MPPTKSPAAPRSSSAALPAHGRAHNLSLVLRTLHSQGPLSRAELSRRLGLTRVTVSDLVAELLGRNHVVELGPDGTGRPGKPAILVDVNRHGLQIIGLDLAEASSLNAAVMDLDGRILTRLSTELSSVTGQAVIDLVLDLADRAVAAATAPLLGIGVGTPGLVDADGTVLTAPNLDWSDVPLGALLQERTGLPTLVANDADAAVMGEFTFGGGGDDLLLVKVGRGVGAGVIVGGRRVNGHHFAAGEIGHVTVGTDGGELCSCGKYGCLETWLAVPRLEAALAATPDAAASATAGADTSAGPRVGQRPDAAARRDPDGAPATDAVGHSDTERRDTGHRAAVLRTAGERLGITLAPVVALLDLAEVVLTGPPELLDDTLLGAVEHTIASRLLRQSGARVHFRRSEDPRDITLRGTAVLVLSHQLGVA